VKINRLTRVTNLAVAIPVAVCKIVVSSRRTKEVNVFLFEGLVEQRKPSIKKDQTAGRTIA
jgi:hypothetical protein